MKNFLRLAVGVNTIPLLQELQRNPDLWNENTLRTKHPGTAHSEVSDIWVFFNDLNAEDVKNDKEVIPYRAWKDLPTLRPMVMSLLHQVEAVRIGRVIITLLPPGKTITPHVDGGAPATYFTRYQIALQCLPGNKFIIGNEEVEFRSGDVWQINNREEHSVINNSTEDRIVCIVDARSE